jgi:murein DD-endopeptidase MepM/ murein hydrolase activator NlpD
LLRELLRRPAAPAKVRADLAQNAQGADTALAPGQELVIPALSAASAADGADGAQAAPLQQTSQSYVVQPGDSLGTIALQFDLDVPTLLGSNELDDPDLLPVGLELTILPVRGVLYPVGEGDTLNRIARRYGLEVRDVLLANGIEDSDLIRAGQELVLPGAKPLFAGSPSRGEPGGSAAPALAAEPAQAPLATFIWPASGPITTYFGQVGWTSPRGHSGLDIAAPWGAPIAAAAGGQVVLATRAGGPYGIEVIVDHGNGLRTVYGHLSELDVTAGEWVERGQLLGLVGSTGFSTGPHLHFEVRQNGELRDPLGYLP